MAKGYIIARVTVDDNDAYMEYAKRARVVMEEFVMFGPHPGRRNRPRRALNEAEQPLGSPPLPRLCAEA